MFHSRLWRDSTGPTPTPPEYTRTREKRHSPRDGATRYAARSPSFSIRRRRSCGGAESAPAVGLPGGAPVFRGHPPSASPGATARLDRRGPFGCDRAICPGHYRPKALRWRASVYAIRHHITGPPLPSRMQTGAALRVIISQEAQKLRSPGQAREPRNSPK